jgi:hypothetical protein
MMIPDITRDPPRDAELAGWLRALDDDRDASGFEPMREMLRSRAQASLARLRRRLSWWEYAAEWSRPAIPAAAAAGLALAFVVGNLPAPAAMGDDPGSRMPYIEEVLGAVISESDYYLVLTDGRETDALLQMAMEER